MIGQTIALFVDAYRDLNSRMLFWITLGLTVLALIVFALFGATPTSITFLHYRVWDRDDAGFYYRYVILSLAVIGVWLSWIALVLALISTGGIFPDLIAGGAIDLYLSKPISRLRLFLTKYVTAMMFVTLQVAVFTTGCYFVMGLRANDWRPSLFLAIPYIVLIFSYIYALCVFFGVLTRSTVAAILLTLLIWPIFFLVAWVDNKFMAPIHLGMDLTIEHAQADIGRVDAEIVRVEKEKAFLDLRPGLLRKQRTLDQEIIADAESKRSTVAKIHAVTHTLHVIFPKTFETNDLLDRRLISSEELPPEPRQVGNAPPPGVGADMHAIQTADYRVRTELREQSAWYVIGTSLLFESVFVAFAAWIFCRRDY